MGKLKSFVKGAAVTGAVAGGALFAAGNVFTYLSLTPNGVKKLNGGKPIDPVINEIYANSVENRIGGEWFDEKDPERLFTFNKYSDCLHAYYIKADEPSDIYVIDCHGFTSRPRDMGIYAKRFNEQGFNVLLPCLRGHDNSEHNYIAMGWDDRLDIVEWISYIIEQNPNAKIILHGVSMGAATVMMTTGEELPANVVCAVEDSGYTSVWDEFCSQITKVFHLPPFPFVDAANLSTRLYLGFDLKRASALEQVKRSKTPTLFIHGDADTFVPFSMLQPLYDAAACEKEMLAFSGVPHAVSALVEPERYWSTVNAFIAKYI